MRGYEQKEVSAEDVVRLINNASFCREKCPVERKAWSCGSRPLKYMKECPILKAYNKKKKKGE